MSDAKLKFRSHSFVVDSHRNQIEQAAVAAAATSSSSSSVPVHIRPKNITTKGGAGAGAGGLKKLAAATKAGGGASTPVMTNISQYSLAPGTPPPATKRKLRVNQILIEQQQRPNGFSTAATDEERQAALTNASINSTQLQQQQTYRLSSETHSLDFANASTKSTKSTSGGSGSGVRAKAYDASKLKSELDQLKKIREDYGTEWLLSTQTLGSDAQYDAATSIASSLQDKKPAAFMFAHAAAAAAAVKQQADEAGAEEVRSVLAAPIAESFVVYRSTTTTTDHDHDDNDTAMTDVCILSLSDVYLIEKDETNTELLAYHAFSSLTDIHIITSRNSRFLSITITSYIIIT